MAMMSAGAVLRIQNELPRTFHNLGVALDYAVTRVRPDRPVSITDSDSTEYLLMQRSPDYTITMTREV